MDVLSILGTAAKRLAHVIFESYPGPYLWLPIAIVAATEIPREKVKNQRFLAKEFADLVGEPQRLESVYVSCEEKYTTLHINIYMHTLARANVIYIHINTYISYICILISRKSI